METRYLRTLVVAAQTGSFSRTAEVLNLTQSAVSQRVKFIEEQYGCQLLDRSGPQLEPTETGRKVLAKVRQILGKEQELLDELRRLSGGKRLSLCCTPTFGTAFLPQVLNRFLLRNADMADFKFIFDQPDQAIKGLRDNEFDLAVIEHCQDRDLADLFTLALPEDELVFISAPRLGLTGEEVSLEALQRYRLFARRDGCSSKRLLQQNLEQAGSSLDLFASVVISDDLRLTIDNVRQGSGISFISRSLVREHLASGSLCQHRVREFRQNRCRSVILHRHREEEPLLRDFLDCVTAVCGAGHCTRAACETPKVAVG